MKTYLSFRLKGEDIFSWFIIMVLVIIIPSIIYSLNKEMYIVENFNVFKLLLLITVSIIIISICLILGLFIMRAIIESVEFKKEQLVFSGESQLYLTMILKGILLTIISLGIYLPWFTRDIQRFYIGKSSYKDKSFSFLGTGEDLFVIMLSAGLLPFIVIVLIFDDSLLNQPSYFSVNAYLFNLLKITIFSPYVYFIYRWGINIKRGGHHAILQGNNIEGILHVFKQLFISAATLGIYIPIASLKIYQYFLQHTEIKNPSNEKYQLGYDFDFLNDFLFIWKQILLSVISIGIYSPWGYCRIMERVLGKTYLNQDTTEPREIED